MQFKSYVQTAATLAVYSFVPHPCPLPKQEMSGVLRPKHVTVVTTNNGTIKSCVSVHKCKHQLIDMQFITQLASFT